MSVIGWGFVILSAWLGGLQLREWDRSSGDTLRDPEPWKDRTHEEHE